MGQNAHDCLKIKCYETLRKCQSTNAKRRFWPLRLLYRKSTGQKRLGHSTSAQQGADMKCPKITENLKLSVQENCPQSG